MLDIKQLSYKKFSITLDVPIYSDCDKGIWITIKYMVRYRIPPTISGANMKSKTLTPCADKKFLKNFFDSKFKGFYRVINKTETVSLDGVEYKIYVPTTIRVNKTIQELRDTSLDDLLNNLEH